MKPYDFYRIRGNSNYPFRVLTCPEVPKIKLKKIKLISTLTFEKVNEIQGLTCILDCTATSHECVASNSQLHSLGKT